jgi:hypothetical protein
MEDTQWMPGRRLLHKCAPLFPAVLAITPGIHAHDAGLKRAGHVALMVHHLVNVLAGHRRLVEPAAEQLRAVLRLQAEALETAAAAL